MEDVTNSEKFVDELNWCIKQLELGLQRQSADSRQTQESLKILKILRSTKAPVVKKRQAMRNALGNYRKKMKDEEKKSLNAMKHSKFKSTHHKRFFGRSKFIRHSHNKEVIHEREDEENKLISMNLNSLSLQTDSVCASNIASSQAEVSGSLQVPVVAGNVGCDQSIHGYIDINKADEGVSLPGTGKVTNNSLCNHGNKFKYCPSDNSFMFDFTEDSSVLKDSKTQEVSNMNNLDGDQSSNSNKSVKENFKYEKSNNSFAFDFNL